MKEFLFVTRVIEGNQWLMNTTLMGNFYIKPCRTLPIAVKEIIEMLKA